MAEKGKFFPKNKDKYKGDLKKIVYRSSWEKQFMILLDRDTRVIKWASESFPIAYRSPIDNKVHRYFPDFIITIKHKSGQEKTYIIEIKPHRETQPPKINNTKKKKKTIITEQLTYVRNQAKFTAAEKFCEKNGWEFKLITEKHMRFF